MESLDAGDALEHVKQHVRRTSSGLMAWGSHAIRLNRDGSHTVTLESGPAGGKKLTRQYQVKGEKVVEDLPCDKPRRRR